MKFATLAMFLGVISAEEPVWSLRSVNDHRTDSTIQKAYGDHSTKQANGRPPYQSAVEISSSSSSSSSDDESNVQLGGDFFIPNDSGTLGAKTYERVIPARFAADDDDIFMRSMIANYAVEAKTPKTDSDDGGAPTGKFWMTKTGAYAAAQEVLSTHKGLEGAKLSTYLDTYFNKAWGHFDVNQVGKIEVGKMHMFIRFLASDQYFQFMQPPKK
jgi:hypothetical protein